MVHLISMRYCLILHSSFCLFITKLNCRLSHLIDITLYAIIRCTSKWVILKQRMQNIVLVNHKCICYFYVIHSSTLKVKESYVFNEQYCLSQSTIMNHQPHPHRTDCCYNAFMTACITRDICDRNFKPTTPSPMRFLHN